MKIRNIIIFAIAFVTLCQCKKDKDGPYPDKDVVIDNAQALMYYHIIFREVENAWAVVHSKGYKEFTPITEENGNLYKELAYNEDKNVIEIDYHTWGTNKLDGKIRIDIENVHNYRKKGGNITVFLHDFTINWQQIKGGAKIKYTGEEDDENDSYSFSLASESDIYEEGYNMPVLITSLITNAGYERIAGGETLSPDDDEWKYWGNMTGTIRNEPGLKYTNTITKEYAVHFTMDCKTAKQGISLVTIPGRANIVYEYGCSAIYFESETLNVFY